MMASHIFLVLLVLGLYVKVSESECPGACSGHGLCGPNDMCSCFKGFMEGDCSARVCQFGMSHVDTPLGDLDHSQSVTGPSNIVIRSSQLYPDGVSEQYPNMINSNDAILDNTAHSYSECSNQGHCDRRAGVCTCFLGYTGAGCQKASCPLTAEGICNGHGRCERAHSIASIDHENIYELWDRDVTHGCLCDPGYHGSACEFRYCKHGIDPLYFPPDAGNSPRFANWSYVIATTAATKIVGNYSILFYDLFGEDWETGPIDIGAPCSAVVRALESLPNDVVPAGHTRCLQWPDYHLITGDDEPALLSPNPFYGVKYTLAFPKNIGVLKQPQINIHLDGARPTIFPEAASSTQQQRQQSQQMIKQLHTFVYPNGFHGETTDAFDRCSGVDVTLEAGTGQFGYLTGLTLLEFRLFCECLGDADGSERTSSATGRVEGRDYSWDYGSVYNPHLLKLVDLSNESEWNGGPMTDLCEPSIHSSYSSNATSSSSSVAGDSTRPVGSVRCSHKSPSGFFVVLLFDEPSNQFRIFNRAAADYSASTQFAVFTTRGTVQMVSEHAKVYTTPLDINPAEVGIYSDRIYFTNSSTRFGSVGYTGNVDCETNEPNTHGALDCIEKGDRVLFFEPSMTLQSFLANPKYLNLYEVKKISIAPKSHLTDTDRNRNQVVLDMSINSHWPLAAGHNVRAFIFRPPNSRNRQGGFEYVGECSYHGFCEQDQGTCYCYRGFEGDDCGLQTNVLS